MHILVVSVPGIIGTYAWDAVDLAGLGGAVAVPMDNCSAAERSSSSSSMTPSLCSLALAVALVAFAVLHLILINMALLM